MIADTNEREGGMASQGADACEGTPAVASSCGGLSIRQLRRRYATRMKMSAPSAMESGDSDSNSGSEDEFDPGFVAHTDTDASELSEDEEESEDGGKRKKRSKKLYVCEECGVAVAKPALLVQHMRSHSDQRTFVCTVSGCSSAYKRQDHLNRHMKKHEGTAFSCSKPGCHQSFTLQSNLQRHLKCHEEKPNFPRVKSSGEKTLLCSHVGCGKLFKYRSQLQTHKEVVHGKLQYAELVCVYPGCGDKFNCEKALVKHAETIHPYLLCEVCGETIPRRSFKRHVWMHATKAPKEVSCPYDGCLKYYTRETNLRQHVRSAHLMLKPFVCSHEGCGKRYAHKASRDRHDLAGVHLPPTVDFEEQDQLKLSKNRGGRKRRVDTVEDLGIGRRRRNNDSESD